MTTFTEPTAAEVADVLDKAIAHIEAVGWHQGYLYDEGQAEDGTPVNECMVCAVGAINTAVYGRPNGDPFATDGQVAVVVLAEEALKRHLNRDDDYWDSVPAWNDYVNMTRQDVVDEIRDTATELRAEATA